MRIMGFDVSKTCTGWGFTDGHRWRYGSFRCPITRPFGVKTGALHAGYSARVFRWYEDKFWDVITINKPDMIGVEQPLPGNPTRQKMVLDGSAGFGAQAFKKVSVGITNIETDMMLKGLLAVLLSIADRKGIKTEFVASQSWRSEVGVPTAPKSVQNRSAWYKERAKMLCHSRDIEVRNGDEADGVCIALCMQMRHDPETAIKGTGLFRGVA